jgi:tetratricopeptide (TPR) repeat protein
VPIDRAAVLRNAEKLLRQGKLEPAIAEYVSLVEDQPRDWTTANGLGDLYVRANQIDNAVAQFARIADSLSRDGFFPRAAALYKKILKLRPDDEHALQQAAEIAAQQGLLVDARAHFTLLAARQRARGDQLAAAETAIRIASLDPEDYEQRLQGARLRFDILDVAGAVKELKAIAAELREKDRLVEALAALREAAQFDSAGRDVQALIAELSSSAGETASAASPADPAPSVPIGPSLGVEPVPAAGRPVSPPVVAPVPISSHQGVEKPVASAPVPAEPPPGRAAALVSSAEVDLSVVLDDIKNASPPTAPDLEQIFAHMRAEALQRLSIDAAEQDFRSGSAFYRAGQFEEAAVPLERASRSARFRFEAAFMLGRMCRTRGQMWPAIEWFERAAEAPASSPDEGHRLLFELADLLELVGEVARALAICLELRTDAGAYEDVEQRIERLTKVQIPG